MPDTVTIRARCPRCGPVEVRSSDLRCAANAEKEGGVCEFICPDCAETVVRALSAHGVQLVLQHGATTVEGAAPIELLEVQTGTPLSRADIAGFRSELDATACPQAELVT